MGGGYQQLIENSKTLLATNGRPIVDNVIIKGPTINSENGYAEPTHNPDTHLQASVITEFINLGKDIDDYKYHQDTKIILYVNTNSTYMIGNTTNVWVRLKLTRKNVSQSFYLGNIPANTVNAFIIDSYWDGCRKSTFYRLDGYNQNGADWLKRFGLKQQGTHLICQEFTNPNVGDAEWPESNFWNTANRIGFSAGIKEFDSISIEMDGVSDICNCCVYQIMLGKEVPDPFK